MIKKFLAQPTSGGSAHECNYLHLTGVLKKFQKPPVEGFVYIGPQTREVADFLYPATQKVAGYYVIQMNVCLSIHPSPPKCIDSGYIVCATAPSVLCRSFFKLSRCFCHGLKMYMWFGYNPQLNFCYFFRILNFVIFSGSNG